MTARAFRCRECGYPFKTADQGWARDAALMCPACGSPDVNIRSAVPEQTPVTLRATEGATSTVRAAASGGR
jgi:DNA-directed RNA polymerase subunit RPC12/RpoP